MCSWARRSSTNIVPTSQLSGYRQAGRRILFMAQTALPVGSIHSPQLRGHGGLGRAVDIAIEDQSAEEQRARATQRLAANPESFEDPARAHSDCISAGEGGFLGQLTPGETPLEFAAGVAERAEGETTRDPVKTRYGFHLIRLERRIAGKTLPFESVASRIGEYLTERARCTATAQYLARLDSGAEIPGIDIAGAEAHRVN
jgi:parvulin-like peptidyl-prolyl isomerase